MSYARFGESDIYAYHDVGGHFICMCCMLNPARRSGYRGDWKSDGEDLDAKRAFRAHVAEHDKAGHDVSDALTILDAEIAGVPG